MPRPDQAVGGQRWRLSTFGDRLDDIGRQEGQIDEMGDPALGDGLAVGNRLHGRAGFDLFEPDPALGEVSEERAVHAG